MDVIEVYKSSLGEFWHVLVPYGLYNDQNKVSEMRAWCRENCERGTWSREDLHTRSNFVFDKEDDVVLFVMRWA